MVSICGKIKPKTRIDEDLSSEKKNEEQSVLRLESMRKAEEILGKYKNSLHRQTNSLSTMPWLVHSINEIINKPNKTIKRHKVKIENTKRAAEYNAK